MASRGRGRGRGNGNPSGAPKTPENQSNETVMTGTVTSLGAKHGFVETITKKKFYFEFQDVKSSRPLCVGDQIQFSAVTQKEKLVAVAVTLVGDSETEKSIHPSNDQEKPEPLSFKPSYGPTPTKSDSKPDPLSFKPNYSSKPAETSSPSPSFKPNYGSKPAQPTSEPSASSSPSFKPSYGAKTTPKADPTLVFKPTYGTKPAEKQESFKPNYSKSTETPSFKPSYGSKPVDTKPLDPKPYSSPNQQRATKTQVQDGVELRSHTGVLKTLRPDKAFGFIQENEKSYYFRFRDVDPATLPTLQEGDQVKFFLKPDPKDAQKFVAFTVQLVRSSNPLSNFTNSPEPTQKRDDKSVKWLLEIDVNDPEKLIFKKPELDKFLKHTDVSFRIMQKLIDLLTSPDFRNLDWDRTAPIYRTVLHSNFIKNPSKLKAYILQLANPTSSEPQENFLSILCLLEELLDRFPQDFTRLHFIDTLESIGKKQNDEKIKDAIERVLQKKAEASSKVTKQVLAVAQLPEDITDFRKVSLFPTSAEILLDPKNLKDRLKKNVIDGSYENVLHYLDVHFRLLREDCVASIRDGIIKYRNNAPLSIDCVFYTNVQVVGIQCSSQGIVYRLKFDLDIDVNWSCSKKLLYGTLLCLSPDRFTTLKWATVAQRDSELLATKQQIDVRFPEGYVPEFESGKTYTMVESTSTYFEAYRHVLEALQNIEMNKFPFVKYLIKLESEVKAPPYLTSYNNTYDLDSIFEGGTTNFPILGLWPELEDPSQQKGSQATVKSSMDKSQMEALKRALSKEFAIIQGPPGTGKTFVGLKVMRALLENAEVRSKTQTAGPILVICFSNHALDQFLEGILNFEESVVRIGGRSQSEALKDRNLNQLLFESEAVSKQHRQQRRQNMEEMKELEVEISQCLKNLQKLNLDREEVKELAASETQLFSLYSKHKLDDIQKVIPSWLGVEDLKTLFHKVTPQEQKRPSPNFRPKDEGEADEEEVIQAQNDRMIDEEPENSGKHEMLECVDEAIDFTDVEQIPERIRQVYDVWGLPKEERLLLFKFWLNRYRENQNRELVGLCKTYENVTRAKSDNDVEMRVAVLNEAKVIGMTTTGVAKFNKIIHKVQPSIIIVEEAAEVLESHIVTALSASTKHLILIGDHEQLRPKTAVYDLTKDFYMDVSLFERMVKNGVEHSTLLRQRRMRPCISALLKVIYPALHDHPHVTTYPPVQGVGADLFFLSHNVLESSGSDEMSLSKSNIYEAEFIAKFCRYLILQGYKSSQITVLTAYAGQVRVLRSELRKLGSNAADGELDAESSKVYVTSVDNYQGEENDIILLSLVRSNTKNIIGFLNTSNRICVALSRARHGMFIIGNGEMLSHKNDVWKAIIDVLKEKGGYGPSIELRCKNHEGTKTQVKCAADFQNVPDGGCQLRCGQKLSCGHICKRRCHPYSHDDIVCKERTTITRECGHVLKNHPCAEEIGPCEEVVPRIRSCGHEVLVPCYFESWEKQACKAPCSKTFECGHPCPASCGEKCPKKCNAVIQKSLDCGHVVNAPCTSNLVNILCDECVKAT